MRQAIHILTFLCLVYPSFAILVFSFHFLILPSLWLCQIIWWTVQCGEKPCGGSSGVVGIFGCSPASAILLPDNITLSPEGLQTSSTFSQEFFFFFLDVIDRQHCISLNCNPCWILRVFLTSLLVLSFPHPQNLPSLANSLHLLFQILPWLLIITEQIELPLRLRQNMSAYYQWQQTPHPLTALLF